MASETLDDPVFGELTYDASAGWWVGEVDLTPKHAVEVFLDVEREEATADALALCHAAFARIQQNEREYRLGTADILLEPYNDGWRHDDEPVETRESFAAQLRLASILLRPTGGAELYYDDDDRFFGGHNITTELDENGVIVDAGDS